MSAPRQSPHARAVDDARTALAPRATTDLRRAFMDHLASVAEALEAIERARRCGCYRIMEEEAIRRCLPEPQPTAPR